MLVMIFVIVEIVGIAITVMILAIGSGDGGCDVKDAVSCDSGMVVSKDTVASVADGGGRGGDAGDSGVVVLVLIDELVGSSDLPIAVGGGGVGGRGVHGSIWMTLNKWRNVGIHERNFILITLLYLDDKSQIKDAVRMAEIGLTSSWTLEDIKVAIAKYISTPPIIMGDEGLLLEIFNKFVNELKEKERKRQEDKVEYPTIIIPRLCGIHLWCSAAKHPNQVAARTWRRSETTTTQDTVVYGDGFSSENRENVKKDAAITEIRGATPSDEKAIEL
ncbi:hypothetical protein T459_28956 [Capsicum annuum]|uniref:Uncharacterized protein n=1 Tax=Capsicum annuum TaxID=4072 RepID=A0A2G2YIC7_CAPAN|nr:hypothetical protein T459_28956 [Capsicum annuum]